MEKLNNKNILLAGASGYLGSYLLKELLNQECKPKIIVRKNAKNKLTFNKPIQLIQAEVTQPETLTDVCNGVDIVISTIGITRQKDGLTYMDVDYQANLNLLKEAKRSGVQKFIYVSAIHGDKYKHLKILEAKELFVDALKISGLDYTIVRPNGFYSDMRDFLHMANSGKVYLFGNGNQKMNPIHGKDLAKAMIERLDSEIREYSIGGPDTLSLNDISRLAFTALNKPVKIVHLPDWVRKLTLNILRTFTSVKTYGAIEFFFTLMAEDQIAPTYGTHRLRTFYKENTSSFNS